MKQILDPLVSRGLQRELHNASVRLLGAAQHSKPFSYLHPAPPRLRKQLPASKTSIALRLRHQSNDTHQKPLTNSPRSTGDQDAESGTEREDNAARRAQEPAYEMTFTCRRCLTRSSHRITKQAYHYGTTLITCPECKSRHLISDHLKIFSDKSITLEDILKEKGEYLKKGRLGEDGDIEFYDQEHGQK